MGNNPREFFGGAAPQTMIGQPGQPLPGRPFPGARGGPSTIGQGVTTGQLVPGPGLLAPNGPMIPQQQMSPTMDRGVPRFGGGPPPEIGAFFEQPPIPGPSGGASKVDPFNGRFGAQPAPAPAPPPAPGGPPVPPPAPKPAPPLPAPAPKIPAPSPTMPKAPGGGGGGVTGGQGGKTFKKSPGGKQLRGFAPSGVPMPAPQLSPPAGLSPSSPGGGAPGLTVNSLKNAMGAPAPKPGLVPRSPRPPLQGSSPSGQGIAQFLPRSPGLGSGMVGDPGTGTNPSGQGGQPTATNLMLKMSGPGGGSPQQNLNQMLGGLVGNPGTVTNPSGPIGPSLPGLQSAAGITMGAGQQPLVPAQFAPKQFPTLNPLTLK